MEACSVGVRDVVLTALHTGMRRGELLALEWRAIDLVRKEIVVEAATEKAGRGRVIPMTAVLHARLSELRAERPPRLDSSDAVFVLPDRREMTPKVLRSAFDGAVRRVSRSNSSRSAAVSTTSALGRPRAMRHLLVGDNVDGGPILLRTCGAGH